MRLLFYVWNYVSTFVGTIGRRNEYFWPGRRADCATAHLVAGCVARGCDGVRYGSDK
jgi:hypothetical protein